MTTTNHARGGFSKRDRALLLGFAVFVEVVLLYMLLVDPLVMRLSRSAGQLETVRRAHAELVATQQTRASSARARDVTEDRSLAPMTLERHGIATVAIQQSLDALACETGVRMVKTAIEPVPELRGGLESLSVTLEVEGDYEAVTAFVSRFEAPDPVRAVERMALTPVPEDADHVYASVTMRVFVRRA